MINTALVDGVIDVHAHWLPTELFGLPSASPFGGMHDRNGELFLGELPLSISTSSMSDIAAIRADMTATGVAVRVLSAPPFAFPVGAGGVEYAEAFNTALADVVTSADGALVGLGMVTLDDAAAAGVQLKALAGLAGIAGVAIPPVVGGESLDRGVLRETLALAADLDLAVLVHPMQLPRPEWRDHYLANLIGNPVETATAVAGVLLGGVLEENPGLRICFVHGGGCAPGLLGRWSHGWHARADVRRSSSRPPAEGFRKLFFDTVTHDVEELSLLAGKAATNRMVCGSDYPFDMGLTEPVQFAVDGGLTIEALAANGRAFLGL